MRGTKSPNYSLIEKIGKMYYILQMNQQNIADKLGISRTSVIRLLAEGRELGIIQVYIRSSFDDLRNGELESGLTRKYKLKDVVVARNTEPNAVCNVGAKYIEDIIPHSGDIAVAGGSTVNVMANYFRTSEDHDALNIAQLTGIYGENVPGLSVVQRWAEKLNANPMYLPVPGIVSSPEKRDLFLNDFNMINTYKSICNAEIAVVGIGAVSSLPKTVNNMEFQQEMFLGLEKKAVGDVMFHFFDENGNFCAEEISSRVVGATVVDFLRIPTRIAVAYGQEKVKAIAGAMRGGIVNIMITDEETAEMVLKIEDNHE